MSKSSNCAWIASVSGRPDIHFYSIFSLDVLSAKENQAQLSRTLSTIFGFGINDDGDCVLGVPVGEVWKAIYEIKFKSFEVVETPTSLCSAYQLVLSYQTVSTHIIKKRNRTGTTNESQSIDLHCSMALPINLDTARTLKAAKSLYITAYDTSYESDESKRIRVMSR